jgi:hypothetical protein
LKKSIGKPSLKSIPAYKFKEIVSKQHLFQTEKVSQYQFVAKKIENDFRNKMAGFKQPIYEIGLQSVFSVYDSIRAFETSTTVRLLMTP